MINLLNLNPAPAAGPALSTNPSVGIALDFSALLTELVGAFQPTSSLANTVLPSPTTNPLSNVSSNSLPDLAGLPLAGLPGTPNIDLNANAPSASPLIPSQTVPVSGQVQPSASNAPLKKPGIPLEIPAMQAAAVAAVSQALVEATAKGANGRPELLNQPAANQPTPEAILEDVKKLEINVSREPVQQPVPTLPKPEALEGLQPLITTDPLASIQQAQLPLRVIAIQKLLSDMKPAERKNQPGGIESKDSGATPGAPVQFAELPRTLSTVEQARPAQLVEIPDMPKLQVVRTVSMEVGDAQSQVTVRIEDRGTGMNLHFGTGNEMIHRSIESSMDSLVNALKQEKIEVSTVEVSRKSPIEKVRRMKEAH